MVAAQQGRARTPPPLHLCLSRRLDISSLVLSDTTNPSCQSGRAPHFAADRSRCSLWAPRLVTCGLNRCSGRASGPVRTRVTLGGARWGSHRAPCGVSPVGPTVARPGRCSVRSSPSSVIARQRPRGGVLTRSRHSWRDVVVLAARSVVHRLSTLPSLGQAAARSGCCLHWWPLRSMAVQQHPGGGAGLGDARRGLCGTLAVSSAVARRCRRSSRLLLGLVVPQLRRRSPAAQQGHARTLVSLSAWRGGARCVPCGALPVGSADAQPGCRFDDCRPALSSLGSRQAGAFGLVVALVIRRSAPSSPNSGTAGVVCTLALLSAGSVRLAAGSAVRRPLAPPSFGGAAVAYSGCSSDWLWLSSAVACQ